MTYLYNIQKTLILFSMMPVGFFFNNSLLFNYDLLQKNVKNFSTEPCKSKNPIDKEEVYQIKTVVIDAGHGGHDAGCSGNHNKEKDIALSISKLLAAKLQQQHPEIKVILTRKDDTFIPLYKRAEIANKNNADLFISIHCNATGGSRQAYGTETFVMGLKTADQNLQVVKRENASIFLEENYQQNYPFDPNSDEGHIMASMFQNTFLEQSILFAEKVEKQFQQKDDRKSRGVKQAGFVVLKLTTMPSVLVETGFLTNYQEENYLATKNGQHRIANSILAAFREYKLAVEDKNFDMPSPTFAQNRSYDHTQGEPNEYQQFNPSPKKAYSSPSPAVEPVSYQFSSESTVPVRKNNPKPVLKAKTPVQNWDRDLFQFKVQLAAATHPINTSEKQWKDVPYQIEVLKEENLLKYQARNFDTLDAAERAAMQLRFNGFPDAFIVVYYKGKAISLAEAKKALGTP